MPVESLAWLLGFAALIFFSLAVFLRLATNLIKILILGAIVFFVASKLPEGKLCHSLAEVAPKNVVEMFCR